MLATTEKVADMVLPLLFGPTLPFSQAQVEFSNPNT